MIVSTGVSVTDGGYRPVIDHLIIIETEYLSFAESGLLAKIEQANRYDLTFSGVQAM